MPSTSFSFHECGAGKENKKVREEKRKMKERPKWESVVILVGVEENERCVGRAYCSVMLSIEPTPVWPDLWFST
jgi:predicted RNA-binding protein